MTWEAKLAACKSLRTITGLAEVGKFLAGREDAVTLGAEQDGGFKVQKLVVGDTKIALPSPEEIAELARKAGIEFEPGMEARVQPFWASDERVDRDGDIIRQNWELAEFLKNPIILLGHRWGSAPIGASLITEVRNRVDDDFQGPALFMLPMFATAEQSEEADRVFRLVKAGFLKTGSVGFFPMEILIIDDPDERAELGLGRWGVIFNRSKLIEFSMVSVPANPGAHTLSAVKALTETDVVTLRELRRRECVEGQKSIADYVEADNTLAKALADVFTFEPLGDLTKEIEQESVSRVVVPKTADADPAEGASGDGDGAAAEPPNDDDGDDEKTRAMLTALVAAEIARQLAPLQSQLQSLNATVGDVRRLLEEQGDGLPAPKDKDPEPTEHDATVGQAYELLMGAGLEGDAGE